MKPIEELTNILCECESVREDQQELRFWTIVKMNWYNNIYTLTQLYQREDAEKWDWQIKEDMEWVINIHNIEKIIWNPIQDHHLRIYCVENGINLITNSYWEMATPDKSVIIKLDMKPLSEQSDETLTKIINLINKKLWKQ